MKEKKCCDNKTSECTKWLMEKWEQIGDKIVSKLHDDGLVSKVESLDFMKALIKSPLIRWLDSFGKSWFKQVFIFLGYASVIFWAIFVLLWLMGILASRGMLSAFLSSIVMILLALVSMIAWIWMVKFKKWYPFVFIVQGWTYLAYIILDYISTYSIPWFAYRHIFMETWLALAMLIISFALILKNKELFKWDYVKCEEKEDKKEKAKEEAKEKVKEEKVEETKKTEYKEDEKKAEVEWEQEHKQDEEKKEKKDKKKKKKEKNKEKNKELKELWDKNPEWDDEESEEDDNA